MDNKKMPGNIELIVYDFDGVMTDNRVSVDQNGVESVVVNRSDGLAVAMIKKAGIAQIILSTETNPVTRKRAEKLGIPCLNGIDDKLGVLKDYLAEKGIDREGVCFIGNDVNDLEAMKHVGFAVAPADAHPDVIKAAKSVTKARGGEGVVREFWDMISK